MNEPEAALLELGTQLKRAQYRFITPTPETHRRLNERALARGEELARRARDVFGYSRPFHADLLPSAWLDLLRRAGALRQEGPHFRSDVRFSSLHHLLLVHSAYPTTAPDAVFFGPDTYRFAALLRRWAPHARRLLDLGCGTGAGALALHDRSEERVLSDINERALSYARVNAALNSQRVQLVYSDVLRQLSGERFDLIIANPPYMLDAQGRTYRDGGGAFGEGLALRIVREALPHLTPDGTLIVYTGAAQVDGSDPFLAQVAPLLEGHGHAFEYEEIDPDVFGEELSLPGYERVERIAAVGLVVRCGARAQASARA